MQSTTQALEDIHLDKKNQVDIIEQSNNKNKFKNFLFLVTQLPHKIFHKKPVAINTVALNSFELQANNFLNVENYEAYINMIKEGYIPPIEQEKRVNKTIHDLYFFMSKNIDDYGIEESRKIVELENILALGYQLKQSDVLQFIFHADTSLFARSNNRHFFNSQQPLSTMCVFQENKLPVLSEQIRTITKEENFSHNLYKLFLVDYSKNSKPPKHLIHKFNLILELSPALLLKNIDLKQFLEISKVFSYNSKEHNILHNNIINQYYAEQMKPFYSTVKNRYTTEFIENLIVNKVKREIEVLKEIPKQALDIIQAIEMTFKNIEKQISMHKDDNYTNSGEHLVDTDNLSLMVEKRIPEVLSKYLTIDLDYRTSLTNMDGKNAQELMIESLQNISNLFDNVYKDMNQQSLHSLSATTKYTKSI